MRYTTITIAALMIVSIIGCSKYEEGPGVSFISKKERVANTWEIDEARENGNDVTSEYDEFTLQLLYDGDASLAALYSIGNISAEFETNGTWEFADDKKKLSLDFDNDDADRTYVILNYVRMRCGLEKKAEK